MSLEGTWADHIIIQAVADALNLRIHIIESSDNFRDMSLVEAVNTTNDQRSIYIAHIGEIHYISTCSEFSERNSSKENTIRKRPNAYMKKYRDVWCT